MIKVSDLIGRSLFIGGLVDVNGFGVSVSVAKVHDGAGFHRGVNEDAGPSDLVTVMYLDRERHIHFMEVMVGSLYFGEEPVAQIKKPTQTLLG